jgi:hypothetical protein
MVARHSGITLEDKVMAWGTMLADKAPTYVRLLIDTNKQGAYSALPCIGIIEKL